jgi:flavin reductase (DIM6/NTAB) family NADH-FMN oxidoreductase RutF
MSTHAEIFKAAMGQMASGVTIVTMLAEGEDHGFTASSFTSLSLDPMLVLVCVVKDQRSHALIEQAGHFAVNILGAQQKELGARFASSKSLDRFAGVPVSRAATGAAILSGSIAWVDCKLRDTFPGGDHSIFVGEVLATEAQGGDEPLVYYARQWGGFRGA